MAQRKYKVEWSEQHGAAPAATAREGATAGKSPAQMLQQLIEERNSVLPEPEVKRWSQRRAVAFIAASASALWIAILVAGAEAAKTLA